jgi:hypothetical protein
MAAAATWLRVARSGRFREGSTAEIRPATRFPMIDKAELLEARCDTAARNCLLNQ